MKGRLRASVGWAAAVVLVAGASVFAQDEPVVEVSTPVANNHELLRKYVWSTLGVDGAIHATLSSGFEQWRHSPAQWGSGTAGYAKRWASQFGEAAVGDTTKYAVARLFHHDPSFTRCECVGFVSRLGHAVGAPFMARTRDGRRVLSPATVAGMLAGHVVPAATWYPAPGGTRDGLRHAGSSLAGKIGVDVLREFWPHRAD